MPSPVFNNAASVYAIVGLEISAFFQWISKGISDSFFTMHFGELYLLRDIWTFKGSTTSHSRISVLLRVSSMRDEENTITEWLNNRIITQNRHQTPPNHLQNQ